MPTKIKAGDLLIAPPNMPDPRFHKSVLFLTHYNGKGAHALCVNRETEHRLSDVIKPLNIILDRDPTLYWGGPVGTATVWMLHDPSWSVENTMKVNKDWCITSHIQMFHHMANGYWPKRFRIMFGHSSWSDGQLDMELEGAEPWSRNSSWLVVKQPDADWLNDYDPATIWSSGCSICSQQTIDSWMT